MSIWQDTTIGDICDLTNGSVQTGPFGSDLHASDYSTTGTPVIMPANLRKNQIVEDGIARVGREHVLRLQNHQLIVGDIVFPRRGDVARYAIIDDRYAGWLCGTGCLRIRFDQNNIIEPIYLGYWLGTSTVENWLLSNAVGTTMPNLNTSILKALPVPLPPLEEQRAIAEILGSLDDKIEANRRMNETLEATARAIFKSWFVDFDPVHYKSRGEHPPGMDEATAALFPDRFEESALGPIPAGWGVGKVDDLGEIVTGKTPSSKVESYFDGDIPFIRIPDMHGKVFVLETERTLTHEGSNSQAKKLLPPLSVCVSCIATPGLVSINTVPSHTNQQINSIVCKDVYNPFFVYFTMNDLRDEIITRGSGGSATLNLNRGEFSRIEILIPNTEIIKQFSSFVVPIFDKILNLAHESRTLAETRDALLPKLVSGEIRVEEIEGE